MVVQLDIYALLTVLVLILCTVYLVFCFVGKEKMYSKVIRLISSFSLVVVLALKMPIETSMNKSCTSSIFLLIIWLINVVVVSVQLKDD